MIERQLYVQWLDLLPQEKQFLLSFSTDGKDSMYCLLACICTATLKQAVTLALKSEVVRTQCTACLYLYGYA